MIATVFCSSGLRENSGMSNSDMYRGVFSVRLVIVIRTSDFGLRTSDCTESEDGELRKLSMEQEFTIAFAAQNRRLDCFGVPTTQRSKRRLHFGHRRLLRPFVAHDSTFAHQSPTRFELRFYQHYNVSSGRSCA